MVIGSYAIVASLLLANLWAGAAPPAASPTLLPWALCAAAGLLAGVLTVRRAMAATVRGNRARVAAWLRATSGVDFVTLLALATVLTQLPSTGSGLASGLRIALPGFVMLQLVLGLGMALWGWWRRRIPGLDAPSGWLPAWHTHTCICGIVALVTVLAPTLRA